MNLTVQNPASRWRLRALLAMLAVLGIVALVWGATLRREVLAWLILNSDAPSPATVEELVDSYRDPVPFLSHLWKTGKLVDRELAIENLKRRWVRGQPADERVEHILMTATLDSDNSVRETALGALAERHSPHLLAAARAQLASADPRMRWLGVHYLSGTLQPETLASLVPLLDDVDLRLVTTVESALQRWSRVDFGVRIAQSIPKMQPDGEEKLKPSDMAAVKRGIAARKAWLEQHSHEYPFLAGTNLPAPAALPPARRAPAEDFVLQDLESKKVRLSDFRGKAVLLNFWATWCTACQAEIPELAELQKRYADQLVILGISLDGVPDEHGHLESLTPVTSPEPSQSTKAAGERGENSTNELRAKVGRMVKAKGIVYPVLLDPNNLVGRRFNGGELPTNVLIDKNGNVCRRFVGSRPLVAWKKMIAEATSGGPMTNGE